MTKRQMIIQSDGSIELSKTHLLTKYLLGFTVLLLSLFVFSVLSHSTVYANAGVPGECNPSSSGYDCDVNPAPAGMPYNIGDYFYNYDNLGYYASEPAYDFWISSTGNTANDSSYTVPAGQSYAPLQFNGMTFLNHTEITNGDYYPTDGSSNNTGQKSQGSQLYIDSATPYVNGVVSGCVSMENGTGGGNPCTLANGGGYPGGVTQSIGSPTNTRYWGWPATGFNYIPAGGFTSTITVTFEASYTIIEEHHSDWYCVNGGAAITSLTPSQNWGCTPTANSFTITFNYTPPYQPPTISPPTGSCTELSFTADDASISSDSVTSTSVTDNRTGTSASLSSQSGDSYTYDISPWRGYGSETFTVSATDSGGTSTTSYTVGPCAGLQCGSSSPTQAILGESTNLSTDVTDSNVGSQGAPPGSSGSYVVNGGGVGYKVNSTTSVSNNTLALTYTSLGTHTVTWSFSYNGVASPACSGQVLIVAAPYFRIFGGDVSVGVDSRYPVSCFDNTGGYIDSFNNNTPGSGNEGAGTTQALIATGTVSGFVSGQSSDLFSVLDPLTFANTSGTYGGSYIPTAQTCSTAQDYYSQAESTAQIIHSDSGVTIATSCADIGAMTISTGNRYICYTTGNVTISGNITYNLAGANSANLPSFEVVTKGNIYVDTDVKNLTGTYIAENGTLCDTGSSCDIDVPTLAQENASTKNEWGDTLTVRGTLIANKMELGRTNGNLANDTIPYTSPTDPADSEEFDYSPINWLAPGDTNNPQVDAITSLPPVF